MQRVASVPGQRIQTHQGTVGCFVRFIAGKQSLQLPDALLMKAACLVELGMLAEQIPIERFQLLAAC